MIMSRKNIPGKLNCLADTLSRAYPYEVAHQCRWNDESSDEEEFQLNSIVARDEYDFVIRERPMIDATNDTRTSRMEDDNYIEIMQLNIDECIICLLMLRTSWFLKGNNEIRISIRFLIE